MRQIVTLFSLVSFFLLSGCSKPVEPVYMGKIIEKKSTTCSKNSKKRVHKLTSKKRTIHQIKSIPSSQNDSNIIKRAVNKLSSELTRNRKFSNKSKSIVAVTSFVCLDDSKSTSRFSNILGDNFIYEMQKRGYKVDSNSNILFSSDLSELNKELNIEYAVVGTYTVYKSTTVVNARIVDLNRDIVLSTAQISIPTRVVRRVSK